MRLEYLRNVCYSQADASERFLCLFGAQPTFSNVHYSGYVQMSLS